jgi:hypothetical protein
MRDIKNVLWPLEARDATFFMSSKHTFKDSRDLIKYIQQIQIERRNTKSHTLENT